MPLSILFLVPFPLNESPSQRFRFEQYLPILKEHNFSYEVRSFFGPGHGKLFFSRGKIALKIWILARALLKRCFILFLAPKYDFVFIHREACPFGPPIFEWLLAKVFLKKIIYDFDDAIWLTDRVEESSIVKCVKSRGKVRNICRWSHRVSCGNRYLASFALTYNRHVVVNPTTIDTEKIHNPERFETRSTGKITIGWTGSHSTLKYLYQIDSVLSSILNSFPEVELLVIADKRPWFSFQRWKFLPWDERKEIEDLMNIDIGIMPLPDDDWTRGKCGFKALQYLALEIPAIVSPVGVNVDIVEDGVTGFYATSDEEWVKSLTVLIESEIMRKQFGKEGRKNVVKHYSVKSNTATFLSLFE